MPTRVELGASPPTSRLHQALWRLSDGAEVRATMQQIAGASGVDERRVRRSLRSFVERGQIVPAGKRGKTTVFRLSPSTPRAEPPSRRDSPQGGSSSTNGRSTAHSDPAEVESEEERRERARELRAWMLETFDGDHRLPPAVLQRRSSLRDEPVVSRLPDVGDRYFEPDRQRPAIWLPPQARFPKPRGSGVAEP